MHARSYDSFTFASDPDQHICELQLVHVGMLTARKQCNAHSAYSKFRSALEFLEAFELAPGAAEETETRWRKDTEAAKAHSEFVQAQEDEYEDFLVRYEVAVGITANSPTDHTKTNQLPGVPPPRVGVDMEVFEKLQCEVKRHQHQLDLANQKYALMQEGRQNDQAEYQQQLDLVNQKLQRLEKIIDKLSK